MSEDTKREIAALHRAIKLERDPSRRLELCVKATLAEHFAKEDATERAQAMAVKPVFCDFEAERAARRLGALAGLARPMPW